MLWFYKIENIQNQHKLIITYNTTITYFKIIIGFIGIFACALNLIYLATLCLVILATALSFYLYKYGNLISWLRKMERKNLMTIIGNKYSFKKPLTITIQQYGKIY